MVLVPAFAIGRTQDLLRMIAKLKTEKKIPDVPVFLDSPMGMRATEVFVAHPKWHRLDRTEVHSLAKSFTLVSSHRQSEDLLRRAEPAIVIAGSGMLTGGRILAHLAGRLSDARNSIVIVGFQAPGTRGSLLLAGIRELKIYGRYVPVGAEVVEISSLSAHADQSEILAWLAHFARPPKNTFIVHGEPQAADALRVRIQDRYHWNCTIPRQNDEFELTTGESKHEPRGERARANHHRPAESP
jgi:metallo-beta-lactamase family protein